MKKFWKIRKAIPSDAAAIAKVQVESYQTAYFGLLPDEFLANFTLQEQEADWLLWCDNHPKDILLVAVNSKDKIVGYALNRKLDEFKDVGEILALHVTPSLKKNGVGKQLLSHSCLHLRENGCNSVILWTLINNPSRGFYEYLHGDLVEEKEWIIEELEFLTKEVCYRWDNLIPLISSIYAQNENN